MRVGLLSPCSVGGGRVASFLTGIGFSIALIYLCSLSPLQCQRPSCTLFQQTFCERRPGPCSALDKLFSLSCDLHVRRVVLTSPPPTTHT